MTPVNRKSPNADGFYIVNYTWDSASMVKQEWTLDFTPSVVHVPQIWTVEIDNTLNASPVYLKFWWTAAASVTVGSTPPDVQLVAPGSTKQTYTFCGGPSLTKNPAYSTQVTWGVTLEPGTLGSTIPVAAVPVRALYRD